MVPFLNYVVIRSQSRRETSKAVKATFYSSYYSVIAIAFTLISISKSAFSLPCDIVRFVLKLASFTHQLLSWMYLLI